MVEKSGENKQLDCQITKGQTNKGETNSEIKLS